MRLLCGDIGGTKTELAVYSGAAGQFDCERRERFVSKGYSSFAALLDRFAPGPVDACGFGIAGPVAHGICHTTNLPWVLTTDELAGILGAPVALANDFQASALGITELEPEQLLTLQSGDLDAGGPVTVLGAGTGFGCAHLPDFRSTRVLPSEAGHADFGPVDATGVELRQYVLDRRPRASVEQLLSGAGLALIFDFLHDTGRARPDAATLEAIDACQDRGRAVGERVATDVACRAAAELFVDIYGSEAANVALRLLPTGGMVLTGGIAPKLQDVLESGRFVRAFRAKAPMVEVLTRIPIRLALEPSAGLLGARRLASMLLSVSLPGGTGRLQ